MARGVNHLDIAPRYGDAELVVGPLVPAVRDRLFIGEKTTRRAADGVRAQLEESLRRLHTDHVDLYQLHAVTSIDVLDERADAFTTIERARDEGLTRFVGITGHGLAAPATFLEALRRYDLDTVMFPVYPRLWADPDYRRDAEELLAQCAARDLGVMVIKAVARQPWPIDANRFASTWYEPQPDPGAIARGVHFALSTPGVHAFCTPGDLGLLPLALDAAEAFAPMDDDARRAAVEAMADLAPLQTP
jgi:predicted aldo/keto reductase-like oxidoreductase